jgi:hypothetical protein
MTKPHCVLMMIDITTIEMAAAQGCDGDHGWYAGILADRLMIVNIPISMIFNQFEHQVPCCNEA